MPGNLRAARPWLIAIGVVVVGLLVASPLVGWPKVTRVAIVLVAAGLVSVLLVRPWRWNDSEVQAVADWTPSRRTIWITAGVVGLMLFWFVLTRFESGSINAIDFSVYYDRPLFQTLQGRFLLVETADDPSRAQLSIFSVHAHWALLPFVALYAIYATPLWLLALSVVAVVGGAVSIFRIVQRTGGGGLVASASALAFALNDNTARTLNYGFHVEVLYAWLIPLLINCALAGRRGMFFAAAVMCIAVKEDAFMLLAAVSVTLALIRFKSMTPGDRLVYLAVPPLLALANLGIYYAYLLPRFRPSGVPFYAGMWGSYGPTFGRAVIGMLASPWAVVSRATTSAFFTRVIVPHLFLPLVGWRWTVGILPVVLLYGAADNDQMRAFGIYYAIVLVPFLVLGAAGGAVTLANRICRKPSHARIAAASAILGGALVAGITDAGYTVRPWKSEIAAVSSAIEALANEPVVLVQSGLYPHAGYESRVQLLTEDALADPANSGAIVLLAPSVNAWPLSKEDIDALASRPQATLMSPGLIAVRRSR